MKNICCYGIFVVHGDLYIISQLQLDVSYMGTFHVHNKWHLHLFNNIFFGSESLPCASRRLFAFPENCGRVPDTVGSYFFVCRAHGQKCTVCPAFLSQNRDIFCRFYALVSELGPKVCMYSCFRNCMASCIF